MYSACFNCSSKAITKAYTPTEYSNIVFEGGCLKLLDISYYFDGPSGKRIGINRNTVSMPVQGTNNL